VARMWRGDGELNLKVVPHHAFHERGLIYVSPPSALDPMQRTYWVECALHGGRIPVKIVDPLGLAVSEIKEKIQEAFDRCDGCIEKNLRVAARLFKAEAAKSRWPEGAEL